MNKSMLSALAVVALFVTAALAIPARAEGLDVSAEGDFGLESFAPANGTASFHVTISNTGSAAFDSVSADADFVEEGWEDSAVSFSDDDGNSSEGSIAWSDLAAGADISLNIAAPVPSGASPGDMGTLNVTITADAESVMVQFSIRVTNWVADYETESPPSFARGDENTYDVEVWNKAEDEDGDGVAITDEITLEFTGVLPGWSVSFDQNDGFVNSITLYGMNAGESATVPVYVTLNDDVAAGPATIELQASSTDPESEDGNYYMQPPGSLSLPADVQAYSGATIGGEGSQSATVDGGTLSWDFTVKNDGNVLDSFDLTWDTSAVDTAGWSTDAAAGSTGYLNMNQDYEGTVSLTIPANEAASAGATFTLTATSTEDSSWSTSADFSASVAQSFGMTVAVAADAISALPGNEADFSFTVSNTGNGFDTYTIGVETLATTYSPTTPADTGSLAAGGSTQFVLGTTVPAGSPAHASSGNFTVTVTSSDGTTAVSTDVSVDTAQVFGLAWSYRTDDADATIDSISVDQGASGQIGLVLTNTGNGADTATIALSDAPSYADLADAAKLAAGKVIVAGGELIVWVDLTPAGDETVGSDIFQVQATGGGGAVTSGDLTATVVLKSTGGPDGETIIVEDEDDGLPGFGLLAALSALGAALLLRRRS
ncbi:MAG: hypothetical protein QF372_01715 [Candidatus Poseidoniia archaeon]|nr:hypothetical protein [Candidatus Poseidoniia archaeon]